LAPSLREAAISTEVEIKLAARAADLPALRRALKGMVGGDRTAKRKLVSTYYDTKDRALARRGCVLRVRKRDGLFIQTVKSAGAAGDSPLARGEWEDPVAGERPDPKAGASGQFLTPEIAGRLAPLFRTEITRLTAELEPSPGTRIEAAIDRGAIRARASKEPIREIELELKSGSVTSLYDAALQLLAVAPVRLDPRSKAERGYRLVGGRGMGQLIRGEPVLLEPTMTAEAALQRIGRATLSHILRYQAAALAGRPEGAHQMRVGARRLRAALSAFRRILPKDQRNWAQNELGRLADTLSEARNLDVFADGLIASARPGVPEAKRLDAPVRRRRRLAHAAVRERIGSPQFTALMLELLRWFDGCGWRQDNAKFHRLQLPIGEVASEMLDRRLRAVAEAAEGFERQSPVQRHRLRIAVKKLRYTAELLGGVYDDGAVRAFTEPLRRLQDDLGHANDVHVGHQIVAALVSEAKSAGKLADAGHRVLEWHHRHLIKREPKTAKHLERLLSASPFWRG
jgi:inorganic triphosphatase YgiF